MGFQDKCGSWLGCFSNTVADRSIAFMSAQAVIFQIQRICFEEKYNVEYNTICRWPSSAVAAIMISSGRVNSSQQRRRIRTAPVEP